MNTKMKKGICTMADKVRLRTGEIVEVYFRHRDGIAYVTDNGVKIIYKGEYEEIEGGKGNER